MAPTAAPTPIPAFAPVLNESRSAPSGTGAVELVVAGALRMSAVDDIGVDTAADVDSDTGAEVDVDGYADEGTNIGVCSCGPDSHIGGAAVNIER